MGMLLKCASHLPVSPPVNLYDIRLLRYKQYRRDDTDRMICKHHDSVVHSCSALARFRVPSTSTEVQCQRSGHDIKRKNHNDTTRS